MQRQTSASELSRLTDKYGRPTVIAELSDTALDKNIISFSDSNCIYIQGEIVNFEDVISCQLDDVQEVIPGKVRYESRTDTRDMVKRAIIGSFISNENKTGAKVGALTAKKSITEHRTPDKVRHNYHLSICVNNLTNPFIKVGFGCEEDLAQKANAFFSVVVARNGQKQAL